MNWVKVAAVFSSVFNGFIRFIAGLFLGYLGQIARQVIVEVEKDPGVITDDDKRQAAFERIKKYAEAEGKQYRDHLVNLAIELAVAWLKKKTEEAYKKE